MFEEIFEGQNGIQNNIVDFKNRLEVKEKSMKSLGLRLGQVEEKVQEQQSRDGDTGASYLAINSTHWALSSHQMKLADLKDRSRRSNLVVFGIPPNTNELEAAQRENVIRGLFVDTMEVKFSSVVRIHITEKASKRNVILYFRD